MIIKLFGLVDILIALIILIQNYFFNLFPAGVILTAGIYLLIKGIAFVILLDFASVVDIICSIIIIFSASMHVSIILIAIIIIWLLQKGFFSMVN